MKSLFMRAVVLWLSLSSGIAKSHPFKVTPTTGPYPLAVTFTGRVHDYVLRFDDEYVDARGNACFKNGVSCETEFSIQHTYAYPGEFTAELFNSVGDDHHHCCKLEKVGATKIQVTGGIPFTLTPASGEVPLNVQISVPNVKVKPGAHYQFNFGDNGSAPAHHECSGENCVLTAEHIYTIPGEFRPELQIASGCGHKTGSGRERLVPDQRGTDCAMVSERIVLQFKVVKARGDLSKISFTAEKSTGDQPFKVIFKIKGGGLFYFDKGEGYRGRPILVHPGGEEVIESVYDVPGSYVAKLQIAGGDSPQVVKAIPIHVTQSRCDGPKALWKEGKIDPKTFSEMAKKLGCDPNQLYP